jgi:hypothetical protein
MTLISRIGIGKGGKASSACPLAYSLVQRLKSVKPSLAPMYRSPANFVPRYTGSITCISTCLSGIEVGSSNLRMTMTSLIKLQLLTKKKRLWEFQRINEVF